ncbi:MAG: hypothetical protein KC486_03990 [Myxococcales bacterium]|nr:hypothetical protein [Myxococcales bacterium]
MCGDGVVEGGEGCDDGNADDLDGCSAACTRDIDIRWCRTDLSPPTSIPTIITDIDVSDSGRIALSRVETVLVQGGTTHLHAFDAEGVDVWSTSIERMEAASLATAPGEALITAGCGHWTSGDVGTRGQQFNLLDNTGAIVAELQGGQNSHTCNLGDVGALAQSVIGVWSDSTSLIRELNAALDPVNDVTLPLLASSIYTGWFDYTFVAAQLDGVVQVAGFSPALSPLWVTDTGVQGMGTAITAAGEDLLVTIEGAETSTRVTIAPGTGEVLELAPVALADLSPPRHVEFIDGDSGDLVTVTMTADGRPTAVRFTPDGDVLWSRRLPNETATSGDAVVLARSAHDGTFVAAGHIGEEQRLWLCKFAP